MVDCSNRSGVLRPRGLSKAGGRSVLVAFGMEIFVLGMTAAAIAYAIGYLLRNIVGVEL